MRRLPQLHSRSTFQWQWSRTVRSFPTPPWLGASCAIAWRPHGKAVAIGMRTCATSYTHSITKMFWPSQEVPENERSIIEITEPIALLASPDAAADVVIELPKGELVEAFGDVGNRRGEWLLVRSSAEEEGIDTMSEKPLMYRDGWLRNASFVLAKHQLREKVTARTETDSHPVLEILRMVPPYRDGPDRAPIPSWIKDSFNELHNGKIGGVVTKGRYLVQRPSGALPERIATTPDYLLVPKERWRRTVIAGLLGMLFSATLATLAHVRAWIGGERFDIGRMAWPQLVGWLVMVSVLFPFIVYPCYLLSNSQATTASVVAWFNFLFFNDLFFD